MPLKNTTARYGSISITLHWLMAIGLISLYIMGGYMVDLSYYDALYHTLPNIHKSMGVVIGIMLIARLVWLYSHTRPAPLATVSTAMNLLARLGHWGLYGLISVLLISGYFISTAKGKGIEVFGWFEIPALLAENVERGEWAGKVHEWAGSLLISLVVVHALAALAHHFYWKDNTLKRMLGR